MFIISEKIEFGKKNNRSSSSSSREEIFVPFVNIKQQESEKTREEPNLIF
jgi:hypothetical protein